MFILVLMMSSLKLVFGGERAAGFQQQKNWFVCLPQERSSELFSTTSTSDHREPASDRFPLKKRLYIANGIVATHDLELAKLEKEEERIFNYHFDGYIKEDKLLFDYKLKQGICKSFNAVVLMRKIGIDV